MAVAKITEFSGVSSEMARYGPQTAKCPPLASQNYASITTNQSRVLNSRTTMIRVHAKTGNLFLGFGASADANSLEVVAGTVEYFDVVSSQTIYLYDGSS